jgi:hypothetical protein
MKEGLFRVRAGRFSRAFGTGDLGGFFPAVNCRVIVCCPFGTMGKMLSQRCRFRSNVSTNSGKGPFPFWMAYSQWYSNKLRSRSLCSSQR